jgi:hypothetical protein
MRAVKRAINRFLIKSTGYRLVKCSCVGRIDDRSGGAVRQDYSVRRFCTQSIFDFFPHWVSKFAVDGGVYGGHSDYTTSRISMLNEEGLSECVNFADKTVLEVGPLEGGNTIIIEKLRARTITAVEGHLENYIRCCVVKNLMGLRNTTFVFDDAMNVTPEKYGTFDIALIAGLLYHLDRPHIFLRQLGRMANQLVVSTHFADAESPSRDSEESELAVDKSVYRGKLFNEGGAGPNSGLQAWSFWPYKDDLVRMIQDAGYGRIRILREMTDRPTGYRLMYLIAAKADDAVVSVTT